MYRKVGRCGPEGGTWVSLGGWLPSLFQRNCCLTIRRWCTGFNRARFGDVSIEESLEMLRTEKISDEQAKVLADGFGVLVEVLKALATPEGEH